jgi:enoyl-CoA hydratase/carnithine racemase
MTGSATPNNDPIVKVEHHDQVTVLEMNSPPHNLVGPALMAGILDGAKLASDCGSRCILLKSGLRNFSAGADLTLFERPAKGQDSQARENGPTAAEFLMDMENIPIPVVTSIHGVCLGGGLEIALTTDYIIAARSARIGSVEATLGLHPIMGGVQRQVERVGLIRAKEMSMLARRYDPATLERWNLINLVVDDEQLEATAMSIAQELGNGPTIAHSATKSLARVAADEGISVADKKMIEIQKPIWRSADLKTGLASFMKRGPGLARFEGK